MSHRNITRASLRNSLCPKEKLGSRKKVKTQIQYHMIKKHYIQVYETCQDVTKRLDVLKCLKYVLFRLSLSYVAAHCVWENMVILNVRTSRTQKTSRAQIKSTYKARIPKYMSHPRIILMTVNSIHLRSVSRYDCKLNQPYPRSIIKCVRHRF